MSKPMNIFEKMLAEASQRMFDDRPTFDPGPDDRLGPCQNCLRPEGTHRWCCPICGERLPTEPCGCGLPHATDLPSGRCSHEHVVGGWLCCDMTGEA